MQNKPIFVLDIHRVCNQKCTYCVANAAERDFGPITAKKSTEDLNWLYSSFDSLNVLFTGGEPLITPNIEEIFQSVINHGHTISIQSNLKVKAKQIINKFPAEKFEWILSTFHSVELDRFSRYLKIASELRRNGYPLVVKLILDKPMIVHFEKIQDELRNNNIPVILSPLVIFPKDAPPYPQTYTQNQWRTIAPRITLLSSWLYFSGGFRSRGIPCKAGSKLFYASFPKGGINGCSHGYPESMGNILEHTLRNTSKQVSCGINSCLCDFHYYIGIIPSADDSAGFKNLLLNPKQTVTFEKFEAWMLKNKLSTLIDLRPFQNIIQVDQSAHTHPYKAKGFTNFTHASEEKFFLAEGESYYRQGNHENATSYFLKALEINPSCAGALNNLGVVSFNAGLPNKALEYFERGFATDMRDSNLAQNYEGVLRFLNYPEAAQKVAEQHVAAIKLSHPAASFSQERKGENSFIKKRTENSAPDSCASTPSSDARRDEFSSHPLIIHAPIPSVPAEQLHHELGFPPPYTPLSSRGIPLDRWKMEIHDAPIFRYLYRNFCPKRHLEFGTWQGAGVVYCLEECDATVWTLNMPFGESKADGGAAYSGAGESYGLGTTLAKEWAERLGLPQQDAYRTDSFGFIGRFYLEKQLGARVCQIYCDSTQWDTSNYPPDFFDSALIDGGHEAHVVLSDTQKALSLLRPGGLIMWHDFCPPVRNRFEVVQGVMSGIEQASELLSASLEKLFWVEPSWILVGIKKS